MISIRIYSNRLFFKRYIYFNPSAKVRVTRTFFYKIIISDSCDTNLGSREWFVSHEPRRAEPGRLKTLQIKFNK